MNRTIVLLLASLLLLASCGDDDSGNGAPGTPPAPAAPAASLPPASDDGDAGNTVIAPIGPALTVPELIAADPDGGPYVVSGYLFVLEDGRVILSELIAESYPPQPGGESLEARGIDLSTVPLVEAPEDSGLATVQWTETPIELIGAVVDGGFVGNTPAAG
jgi:hypothetical protein